MRKVLSLVLVLALVLSSFSMAFADDTAAATTTTATNKTASDIEGKACEQAVKVLLDLDVVTGYPDGTFQPDKQVTRAEAAVIVIKMLGLENKVGTQKSNYTDMAGYGWAEPYIAFASNLGILQGDGNGKYRPGDAVSYNEFAKIMVAALGYTADSLTGTWPANYVNKAMGLGIMDDVVSGGAAPATRGDVAIMVKNNLTNFIGTIDKDGNFHATVVKEAANAANNEYDSPIYRLGGTKVVGVIDSTDDAVINAKAYLGKYCEYYTNSDGDIIAVKEVKSTTIVGDFTADGKLEGDDDVDYVLPKIDGTGNGNWKYNEDGNTYDHVVITNGVLAATSDDPVAVPAPAPAAPYITLEVKLSGKTVKEVYSEMTWNIDAAAKVKAGDIAEIKDDTSLLGYDFTTNKDGSINEKSFELVGAKSLNDIKADDIVYVYVDGGSKEIVKVAVGTEVVEGKVTKVNGTDNEWKVNGKTYGFVTAGTEGADAYADKLDNEVKLYLDAYGDIYKYEVTAGSADQYAVITKADAVMDKVKAYLADDTTKTFELTNDCTESVAAADAGKIAAYSINKDGDFDDYIVSNSDLVGGYFENNKLFKVTTDGGVLVSPNAYKVDGDVTVFISDDMTDIANSSLSIGKIDDLDKGTDGKAMYVVYYTAADGILAVIASDSVNGGTSTDSYAVISGVDKATNGVGDKAQELTGFIDGKKMKDVFTSGQTVAVAPAASLAGINLYKVKYNADNNISKLTAVGNTPVTNQYAAADIAFQYVSDGYLTLGAAGANAAAGTTYAVATNAQIYKVTFKSNNNIDEYSTFGGTIKAGDQVWMFNYDDDDNEYDVVIVKQN